MHLLYLDESGQVGNRDQRYCVLAGVCVYETRTHWIEGDMNAIAERYFPGHDVEFHASNMLGGRGVWRGISSAPRREAIAAVLESVRQMKGKARIFASVVDKRRAEGIDVNMHMFQQTASRFDMFLSRIYRKTGKPERGIMIFDKTGYETQIQTTCHLFQSSGHQWGTLRNLAEVPMFLDSAQSRLLQLADLIAYAIFRRYEFNDDRLHSIIEGSYDREGNIVHGLHVL